MSNIAIHLEQQERIRILELEAKHTKTLVEELARYIFDNPGRTKQSQHLASVLLNATRELGFDYK